MSEPDNKGDEPDRVIIRDKRRIDPQTGQQREPDPDPATDQGMGSPEPALASLEDFMALESAVDVVNDRQ